MVAWLHKNSLPHLSVPLGLVAAAVAPHIISRPTSTWWIRAAISFPSSFSGERSPRDLSLTSLVRHRSHTTPEATPCRQGHPCPHTHWPLPGAGLGLPLPRWRGQERGTGQVPEQNQGSATRNKRQLTLFAATESAKGHVNLESEKPIFCHWVFPKLFFLQFS